MEWNFAFNPSPDIQVIPVGRELRPVMVVDNLLLQPRQLLDFACRGAGFQFQASDFYPGVRKRLPVQYAQALCRTYSGIWRDVFGIEASAVPSVSLCALSMTITIPEKLRPIQRLPHFDSGDSNQLAAVHYLCHPHHGGTAFYRHRQTGFETVNESRLHAYAKRLKQEVTTQWPPAPRYINGDTALFKQTASIAARFNRILFYPGNLLHSGNIQAHNGLSRDPRRGRLTANTFIKFTAAHPA